MRPWGSPVWEASTSPWVRGRPIPIVIARIFDDSGTGGTSGFNEPFVRPSDVPSEGSGFLVGPSDVSQFRFNIGIRTLDDPVSVTATVRDTSGTVSTP